MRLCSLLEPARGLAIALMGEGKENIAFPGKKPVLLSELEYDTLRKALCIGKKMGEGFCDGKYQVPYQEDRDAVFNELFLTDGMYNDILHPMIFDTGFGQKGYVVHVDGAYAASLQLFAQMYGQLFGMTLSLIEEGGV